MQSNIGFGFSREGLSEPIQEGAPGILPADSAYAAVRVVSGNAAFEDASTDKRAHILTCADDLSPVILEVARKVDFTDFKTLSRYRQGSAFSFDGTVLTYTGISNDRFKFFADQSNDRRSMAQPLISVWKKSTTARSCNPIGTAVWSRSTAGKRRVLDFNGKFKP